VRYHAAKRGRLHEDLVSQIEELIEQDQLRPGDKLPSENDLAGQFDVSRTVVREAVRALEEKGLVEVKHGSGVYVTEPSIDNVTSTLALQLRVSERSVMPLLEVREILEVEIAGLAAERATKQEREDMEKALRLEAELVNSHDEYVEADLRFHELLSKAAHNEVLPILLGPLAELLRKSRRVTSEPPGSAELSFRGHKEILEAVKDRDKERAREAMRQHFRMVRKVLRTFGYPGQDKSPRTQ
jgi:GntR family transcriptional repressor for pyruvate dehydrogenase complex